MKVAHDRRKWLIAVSAYTLSGLLASSAVGALLGRAGQFLPALPGTVWALLLAATALLFAAREFGWISFPLPQRTRQTEKLWYHQFGPVGAPILWGLHIGAGFNTRINFSGYWILVAFAVFSGDPRTGALIYSAYWLGRALSVWLAPVLAEDSWRGTELLDLANDQRVQSRVHAWGLIWAAVLLAGHGMA